MLTEDTVKVIVQEMMNNKVVLRSNCLERHNVVEAKIRGLEERLEEVDRGMDGLTKKVDKLVTLLFANLFGVILVLLGIVATLLKGG